MLSRINRANLFFAQSRSQSIQWPAIVRKGATALVSTAHRALLVLGTAAITALCMMFFNPNLADLLKALSPFAKVSGAQPVPIAAPPLTNLLGEPAKPVQASAAAAGSTPVQVEELNVVGTSRQQQWVTNWLSKRYHVAGDAANMLVSASYLTARETKLDPLLILAVMCVESGLNPFAESAVGAQGLMQVMSKIHHARFDELGGMKAALNPVANIKVGAMILRDFVVRGGSVEAGLKLYVGAGASENDAGYGSKVLAEYHRLQEVASGKNVPTMFAPIITTALKQQAPEPLKDGKVEPQNAPQSEPDSASLEHHQPDLSVLATL